MAPTNINGLVHSHNFVSVPSVHAKASREGHRLPDGDVQDHLAWPSRQCARRALFPRSHKVRQVAKS